MAEQLPLPLRYRTAHGVGDFIVSEANLEAVRLLDLWPAWPHHAVLLLGPPESGKSHLGAILSSRAGGLTLRPGQLHSLLRAPLLVIEDLDGSVDQEGLFHMMNRAQQDRFHLMLLAREDPVRWGLSLPDLASRLTATPRVAIMPPDDALIAPLLLKRLRDRGLTANPEVLTYLASRLPRTFDAFGDIVDSLDALSLADRANLTVPLARRALATLDAELGFYPDASQG